LVGSVAARAHGVDVDPGDYDIVPATSPENFEHGLFDVVPWRAGRYDELAPRASPA
jgi:hypothetical protein